MNITITPYYLKLILLKDCTYSNNALDLVKKINIKYKSITIHENKDRFKKHPNDTFPQIYLKRVGRIGEVRIGGYTDLYRLYQLFYKKPYNENIVNQSMKDYNLDKHTILRLIELLNISKK